MNLGAQSKNDPPAKFQADSHSVSGTVDTADAGAKSIALVGGPKPYDVITPTSNAVLEANNFGGASSALKVTAFVPATMAVCYLLLVLFFAATGGYKPLHLETTGEEVAGPTEADCNARPPFRRIDLSEIRRTPARTDRPGVLVC